MYKRPVSWTDSPAYSKNALLFYIMSDLRVNILRIVDIRLEAVCILVKSWIFCPRTGRLCKKPD